MDGLTLKFTIDPDVITQAQDLDADAFLAGPGRGGSDIVIDPIFATALPTAIADLALDAGLTLEDGRLPQSSIWPLIATYETFGFKEVVDPVHGLDFGVTVHDLGTDRILGLYTGCTLVVDPANQGHSLGRKLVLLRYLRNASLPLWDHDEAGFTPAGAATHYSAYRCVAEMTPP